AAHRARVLRQLREFLTSGLHPGDRVMVVSFDHGLQVQQPFTTDRSALARARRTALEQTLVILEMSKGISAAADRMSAAGSHLGPNGPRGGGRGGGGGSEGGGGEGGEEDSGGGS